MEQNNFNEQVYTEQPQTYVEPVYAPEQPVHHADLEECVGSAFGKGLAATIMASFPVCSIISIILGAIGLKNTKKANEMAQYYGVSAGGKNIAARILSIIGLAYGAFMTLFYLIYIIGVAAMVAMSI